MRRKFFSIHRSIGLSVRILPSGERAELWNFFFKVHLNELGTSRKVVSQAPRHVTPRKSWVQGTVRRARRSP